MNKRSKIPGRRPAFIRRSFVALLISILLCRCSDYQVTLNETVVYTPPPLFTNFSVADKNLRACIEQTIQDGKITAAEEVKRLHCSHAGIKTLQGIGRFSNLREVSVSHNQLSSLQDLQYLTRLRRLMLDHNSLVGVPELLGLARLQHVDLSGNEKMTCRDARQLHDQGVTVVFPGQCQ